MKISKKKFYSKLWLILPSILFLSFIFSQLISVAQEDRSLTALSNPEKYKASNINPSTLTFKIHSLQNNLGIVAVNTTDTHYKRPITFKIKEEGSRKWLHTVQLDTQTAVSRRLYFGFPTINNSQNKTYTVELSTKDGNYLINYILARNNQVSLKYIYSKNSLITNKKFIPQFILYKIVYTFEYLNMPTILAIFILMVVMAWILKKNNLSYVFSYSKLSNLQTKYKVGIVIVLGLFVRLLLATGPYNFDVTQWIQIGQVSREHLNIYAYNQYYNYSPFWFLILGVLDKFNFFVYPSSYSFLVRAFLSLIDIAIFSLIYLIAKQRKLAPLKTACLYYLNPVIIIISGHHGQFDNIAILFFLLAIYFYLKDKLRENIKMRYIFAALTIGLIVKHVIVFQVFYFYRLYRKNLAKAIFLFILSVGIFLLTLLPFMSEGTQIIKRVFLYGGVQGLYGLSYFIGNILGNNFKLIGVGVYELYKLLFLSGYLLFVILVKPKDIVRGILLSILFFLTFTSGIGAQYFILPIAVGVFFPTRWFYLYSLIVTLFYLGSSDELNLYTFKVFEWNTVWLFVIFYFTAEVFENFPNLKTKFKYVK